MSISFLPGTGARRWVRFKDREETEHEVSIEQAAVAELEFCLPARDIPHYRDSAHTPGAYWSATAADLLEYESYLECQWMMLLDFDPNVVAFSAQPFTMHVIDVTGRFTHTPDLFARYADGTGKVIDVKNPKAMAQPEVVAQAEASRKFCADAGWGYEMVSTPDPQFMTNVAWLAGYRRPLHAGTELADQLVALAQRPMTIAEILTFTRQPDLARSVLFHLLWHHLLHADLTVALRETTVISSHNTGGNAI